MKILCIGGCKDGQWIENVYNGQDRLSFAKLDKLQDFNYTDSSTATAMMETDSYRIERIRTEKERFQFFVVDGMSIDQMIIALMQDYHPYVPEEERC